jgi:hypothetical protein
MNTFSGTYRAAAMMAAVAEHVGAVEVDEEMAVHTITLILDGRHGEFNLVVEATDMDTMEEHRYEGIAYRHGGVVDFKEVEQ